MSEVSMGEKGTKVDKAAMKTDFCIDLFADLNVSQARLKKGFNFGMCMELYMTLKACFSETSTQPSKILG